MGIFNNKNSEKKKREKDLKELHKIQEEYDLKLKKEKQKYNFKSILSKLKFETYTKRLVFIVVFISLIDLQLSYILAFLDKMQIAETLSNQICVTLLGTVLIYAIRAYFDTKAEKRDEMIKEGYILPQSKISVAKSVVDNKVNEVLQNSGLQEYVEPENLNSNLEESINDDICG